LTLAAAHACETCLHLYRDETAKQVIRAHCEEVERRIRLKYLVRMAFAHFGCAFRWFGSGSASRARS
jgi:hypothetical protein